MKPNKRQEKYAAFFQALSHRRRQMICDILLKQGPKGLTFGELQRQSGLYRPRPCRITCGSWTGAGYCSANKKGAKLYCPSILLFCARPLWGMAAGLLPMLYPT